MEYQASRDGGRLERIASRLAKDPTVVVSIRNSTAEIRAGKYGSSLLVKAGLLSKPEKAPLRKEEDERTAAAC